jgi:hypothetical protein
MIRVRLKDLTVSAEWKTHPDPPRFSTRSITDENEQPGLAGSQIPMSFHHIVVSLVCALSEMRKNVANPFLLKLHQLIPNSMTRRGPALGGYALTGLVSSSFHLYLHDLLADCSKRKRLLAVLLCHFPLLFYPFAVPFIS